MLPLRVEVHGQMTGGKSLHYATRGCIDVQALNPSTKAEQLSERLFSNNYRTCALYAYNILVRLALSTINCCQSPESLASTISRRFTIPTCSTSGSASLEDLVFTISVSSDELAIHAESDVERLRGQTRCHPQTVMLRRIDQLVWNCQSPIIQVDIPRFWSSQPRSLRTGIQTSESSAAAKIAGNSAATLTRPDSGVE